MNNTIDEYPYVTGSRQIYPIFYALYHYMVSQNWHANIVAQFYFFQKSNPPVQNLLVELFTGLFIYLFTIHSSVSNGVPVLVFIIFNFPPKSQFSFLHLKRDQDLEGNLSIYP